MEFELIDIDRWPGRERYRHYMDDARCTFSITANIDVTRLKREVKSRGLRMYPTCLYLLATVVNSVPELRYGINSAGRLGVWDVCRPLYTVFNSAKESFSCIWTEYSASFPQFYCAAVADIDKYSSCESLYPMGDEPPGCFSISSIPWVSFTGFNLNLYTAGRYLPPIFTIGKYFTLSDTLLMPISLQAHHSVCDGFHAAKAINMLGRLSSDTAWMDK